MKKNILVAVFCLVLSAITFAQVPQVMSYQAVVRGSDNNLVVNQQISMRVSILQGSTEGEAVYTETHSATTNANGLVSIEIGNGTSNDEFYAINWANGPYFVKTETDVNGGENYEIVGVSQLLSVPYAMYAQSAGNVPDVSGFLSEETDPQFNAWDKDYNDLTNRPEIPAIPTNVSAFTNDANYLTSYIETDPQFNAWDKDYNDLTNRPEIPTVPTNVSAFQNDVNYLTSYTETDPQFNAWDKDYNDLTNRPEIPTVPTNVSAFENDANYLTSYTETDPTISAWAKAENKPTYDYSEITNTPELFDGNYNNLTNRPEIPIVPTNVSAFENDANYIVDEMQSLTDVLAISNSASDMQIKNVADPTENQDAVTKKYVDEIIATLQATIDSLSMVVQLGGHAFVDLGLPSGTLWANCNVGASRPEDYGNYFAWGETTAKDTYNWSTYRYCNGSNTTLTKYCYDANNGNNGFTDNLTTLQSSDDAATANWSNGWRMPTSTEMQELIDNCSFEWTTLSGVNGGKFTGNNGNSIFFPAGGYYNNSEIRNVGSTCNYNTGSLNINSTDCVIILAFDNSSEPDMNGPRRRSYGQLVRPVYNPNNIGNGTSEPTDPSQQEYYTVTYNANGGTGTMASQIYAQGVAQALTANTFTRTYYTFTGWNTAANGSGVAYTNGQSVTLTCDITLYAQWEASSNGTFIDSRDGNIYRYVTIGSQMWMAENLRYEGNTTLGTTYSTSAKYRYYPGDNESSTYGYLYNWPAAMDGASGSSTNPSGVQGICPNGWHLPSSAEWTQLTDDLSGRKAKALASTSGWRSCITSNSVGNPQSSNNSTGFGAMPAGEYSQDYVNSTPSDTFSHKYMGSGAYFWSATTYIGGRAYYLGIGYCSDISVERGNSSNATGYSVRCIRD